MEDKVAVVVGGTSGIGAATVRALTREGADVVVAGRRAELGNELAAQCGPNAIFIAVDVTNEASVEALMTSTLERFGRLDCLVNSAGGGGGGWSITTLDLSRLEATMALYVGGVVAAMRHAAPIMMNQGSGAMVNIASVGGVLAGWSPIDYSAAKAAVIHLTRWAALELGEHGIRANSVSPGPVPTGIFAKAVGINSENAERTAPGLAAVFASSLAPWRPLPRVCEAADVAAATVWLASDAAALITGQDLAIDAGLSVGPPASVLATGRAELAAYLQEAARATSSQMTPPASGP